LRISRGAKLSLRTIAILYLTLLLLLPIGVVLIRTFEHGFGTAWNWMTTPAAVSALWLSLLIALIAVPLNTVFGILASMVLVRSKVRGRAVLDALIDLPFVVSPVIVGLSLILVYGKDGWFGNWLIDHGITLIYNPAGMIVATVFVSLPFVVREVAPVLMEVGDEQEQAASTLGASSWQAFRRITLPSIRWGLTYGVVLTVARTLGEFGAVIMVSSNLPGQSQTLTLLVADRYGRGSEYGAYAVSTLLMSVAVIVLIVQVVLDARRAKTDN